MTDGNFYWVFQLCIDCLTFGTGGFYLLYATVILLAGIVAPKAGSLAPVSNTDATAVGPADIGGSKTPILNEGGIVGTSYVAVMNLFKPMTFILIAAFFLRAIKWCLGISDKGFEYWAIFKRLVIFYFLVIPLPAAFLPPVDYPQAQPDAHLLSAVVLLILVNAFGDLISTRITIRNFGKVISAFSDMEPVPIDSQLKQGVKFELKIYLTTLLDLAAAVLVLCFVLMISSVLFGVQVGAYKFGFDAETLSAMFNRAKRFPELAYELYWFRDVDGAATTGTGIPGMFLYAITTFLPTLIMLFSALFWTLTIPLRIVLQLPRSRIQRIFAAELSVFAICLSVTGFFSVSVRSFYSFLITIWTT